MADLFILKIFNIVVLTLYFNDMQPAEKERRWGGGDVIVFSLCYGGGRWLQPSLFSIASVSATELEGKERYTAAAQSR